MTIEDQLRTGSVVFNLASFVCLPFIGDYQAAFSLGLALIVTAGIMWISAVVIRAVSA